MDPHTPCDVIADVVARMERAPQASMAIGTTGAARDELARLADWWREVGGDRDIRVAWLECTGPDAAAGVVAAERAVDAGATLVVPATPPADDVAARAAIAVLCHRDAAATTHQPSGMTDREWTLRCARVRDRMALLLPHRGDPEALLASIADDAVSAMVGSLLAASARRTPSLVGGTRAWAAAVIADRMSPTAGTWWRAVSTSPDPADVLAMERIEVCPGLPLGIDADDQSGARATLALLDVARSG